VKDFPDGVYFVPLAAVTSTEVMWTAIAETLDVPPEGRIPPGFFTHVAHRSALLVLDNLEQLPGADTVVADLLREALRVVVVATSRRPLHVSGEHEHPVPPLELPDGDGVDTVARSGAVRLFVERAGRVRPSFALTADNAADLAAICRRLDGLPLALELAAARSKLLSPRALLARLDTALDLAALGGQGPSRQKTLRDTIAWSYDLLNATQQIFFARLGVFSGGADLDAIAAVTTDDEICSAEPLDLMADLVDASLIIVSESADGEPRFGMLETIRAFALDRLGVIGELDTIRERHAHHYVERLVELSSTLDAAQYLIVRTQLDTELDNFREVLRWSLRPDAAACTATPDRAELGLRVCSSLGYFWFSSGYFAEGRGWFEQAVEAAGDHDSAVLARCLKQLSDNLSAAGNLDRAYECATSSVDMWRRLGDTTSLATAVGALGALELERGHADTALTLAREALECARRSGAWVRVIWELEQLASVETYLHNHQHALELQIEDRDIAQRHGAYSEMLDIQQYMASTLRAMGRLDEAKEQFYELIPHALEYNEQQRLMTLTDDYAAILTDVGDHRSSVHLLGAADAMRERLAIPRMRTQREASAETLAKTRAALAPQEWHNAYQTGSSTTVEEALRLSREKHSPG
jgi:predicted ATPase